MSDKKDESVNQLLQWWRKRHGPRGLALVHSWHEFAGCERSILNELFLQRLFSVWIHVSDGTVTVWQAVADMCTSAGLCLAESPGNVQVLLVVGYDNVTLPDWCVHEHHHVPVPLLVVWDTFGSMFVRDTMRFHFRDLKSSQVKSLASDATFELDPNVRPLLLSSNKTLIERPVTDQPFHRTATYGQVDNVSRFFSVLRQQCTGKGGFLLRSFPNLVRLDLYIDTKASLDLPPDWRRLLKLLDGWIDRQPKLRLMICYCTAADSMLDTRRHFDLLKRLRHYAQRKLPASHEWYQHPSHQLFTRHLGDLIFECLRADFWTAECPGDTLHSDLLQFIDCVWSAVKKANSSVSELDILIDSMPLDHHCSAAAMVIRSHPLYIEQLSRLSTVK